LGYPFFNLFLNSNQNSRTLLFKKEISFTSLLLTFTIALFANGQTIKAEEGFIDLRNVNLNELNSVSINGEWIFFPDTLINPSQIELAADELPFFKISVPTKKKELGKHKFGTYFLKLKLNPESVFLTINSLTIYSAAAIFVNGNMVGNIGSPGNSIELTKPGLVLQTKYFHPQKENNIVIHFSNFHREKSGIANNISLVSPKYQIKQAAIRIIKYAIIIGTILFIIFNQINYFIIRRKNRTAFYFGLASIMIACYIIFMSFYYLGALIPNFNPNFFITLKTWRISYYFTVCFFALYIRSLFPSIYHKSFLYFTVAYSSFSALLTLFFPLHISSINFNIFMYVTLIIALHGVLMGIIGSIRKIEDSGLFVFGFAFFIATVINDILHNLLIINSVNLLDVGIFGMMLTQAQIINSKLNRSLLRSEDLSEHLQYVNANLENLVNERTEEIEEQKTEIETQRDFAMSQHSLIARQKKTITDSINYAREIQQAVLPDEEILKKYFEDSFILFKPKDFVSGDFYWIRHFKLNDTPYLLFCVADCTGHGVPGALLSMLGMSLLGEVISHNKISSAAEVLELLRKKFKDTLCSHSERENSSDGMHITLCLINKDSGEMQYSGAFQALYHIRNNKVNRIKGTNCIIGSYMLEIPFVNHNISLEPNDRLYLFTDGFADQMAENGQGRFMRKRLINLLCSFDGEAYINQRNRLDQEFESWKGNFDQIDDVLVMGVKV
jgi:serine phosphatase RsbU (regulator of sigma subunit)